MASGAKKKKKTSKGHNSCEIHSTMTKIQYACLLHANEYLRSFFEMYPLVIPKKCRQKTY